MNDTSPEIEQRQVEILMSLGSKRRIEMACEMYMGARMSILGSLPSHLSESVLNKAFIDKMCGKQFANDFFNDEVK